MWQLLVSTKALSVAHKDHLQSVWDSSLPTDSNSLPTNSLLKLNHHGPHKQNCAMNCDLSCATNCAIHWQPENNNVCYVWIFMYVDIKLYLPFVSSFIRLLNRNDLNFQLLVCTCRFNAAPIRATWLLGCLGLEILYSQRHCQSQ